MAAMRVKPASPLTEKHIFENQSVKVGLYHIFPLAAYNSVNMV